MQPVRRATMERWWVVGGGWRTAFVESTWEDVRALEAAVWEPGSDGYYMLDIIDSVLASGRASDLAVATSMHDLVVVTRPLLDPPMDVLIVRAPGSLHEPAPGAVAVEYLAVSGRNTRVERTADAAVRLFWRFAEEKWGVRRDSST